MQDQVAKLIFNFVVAKLYVHFLRNENILISTVNCISTVLRAAAVVLGCVELNYIELN